MSVFAHVVLDVKNNDLCWCCVGGRVGVGEFFFQVFVLVLVLEGMKNSGDGKAWQYVGDGET